MMIHSVGNISHSVLMKIFHLKPSTDHLQTEMSRPSEETEDDLGPPVDTNRILRSLKTSISLGQSVETYFLILLSWSF